MLTSTTVPEIHQNRPFFPSSFYTIEAKPDKTSSPITYKFDNPALRDMKHIFLHAYKRRWALAVDVDLPSQQWLPHLHSFCASYPDLAPSWVFHSLTTGHAHMIWTIEPVTTGPKARTAPQNFARDIQSTLCHVFAGDTAYNGDMTYNPLYNGYVLLDYAKGTHRNPQMDQRTKGAIHLFNPELLNPRSLNDLYAGLRKADLWEQAQETRQKRAKKSVFSFLTSGEYILKGERNERIFYEARHDPRDPFVVTHEINNSGRVQPPLSYAEVEAIARSIASYRSRKGHRKKSTEDRGSMLTSEQKATLAQWGHKGGSRNTEAQAKARQQNLKSASASASVIRSAESVGRYAQIKALKAEGYTTKRICELLGIERTTVYRALKSTA